MEDNVFCLPKQKKVHTKISIGNNVTQCTVVSYLECRC